MCRFKPADCRNRVVVRHVLAGREDGEHIAGERCRAGDTGKRGGRSVDLHQIERTGLEGEIALDRHRLPDTPAAPGANVPPELSACLPTVPTPMSMPPLFTLVRLELAIEPSTSNVPPLTAVAPVYGLMPDSVSVPVQSLSAPSCWCHPE